MTEKREKQNEHKVECSDTGCILHNKKASLYRAKLSGKVVSDKMQKSVVVEVPFFRKIPKYQRYEKRKSRITAHNPACIDAKAGDNVTVQKCKPLSKTKSFIVIKKHKE